MMRRTKTRNRLLFVILSCFLTIDSYSQAGTFNYCQQTAALEDFIVDSALTTDDAEILIVTNRPFLPQDSLEVLLDNAMANNKRTTYLIATCQSKKWHLFRVDDLKTGLDIINDGHDLLLFIHGNGKTFPMALSRTSKINFRYNIPIILFDWPSRNMLITKSVSNVRALNTNFYKLLTQLKGYRQNSMNNTQHLSVFAHSLGNYFLTNLVMNENNKYLNEVFIDNLILNSSAVETKKHGIAIDKLSFQKNIYITVNFYDKTLRGANLLTLRKMLGNIAVPPLANKAEYMHFTSIAGYEHTYFAGYHQFEFDNRAVFEFYNSILHGSKLNLINNANYIKRTSADGYDVLCCPQPKNAQPESISQNQF